MPCRGRWGSWAPAQALSDPSRPCPRVSLVRWLGRWSALELAQDAPSFWDRKVGTAERPGARSSPPLGPPWSPAAWSARISCLPAPCQALPSQGVP